MAGGENENDHENANAIDGQRRREETWSDERERRQQALRELAARRAAEDASPAEAATAQNARTGNAPRPATLRPPRRTRPGARQHIVLFAVALALLVVSVGAGAIYVRRQSSAAHVAPPARTAAARLSISPAANGIALCGNPAFGPSASATWSPDGQSIAVLGYVNKCPSDDPISYAYQPGVVAIYSAATGALIGRFNPDPAIAAALRLKPPQLPAPGSGGPGTPPRGDTQHQIITYGNVLWSPDGTRLALLFAVDYFYNVQVQGNGVQYGTASWYGVATMAPSGGSPVVVAGPTPTFSEDSPAAVPWEYDLVQGRYVLPPTAPSSAYGVPQPRSAGLAYAWNPDGTLAIQQALPPGSVPKTPRLGPVGNPTHDASFTIWQPGRITPDSQFGLGVYQYTWQFAAWSPDGRYVMPPLGSVGFGFGELLVPRKYGLTPQQLASDLNPAEVYLPMRDAALRTLLQQDITGAVAWSPDGRRLAVIPEILHGNNDQGADLAGMRLYDCASGYETVRFTGAVGAGEQAYQPTMAWSPDGKQLMVFATISSSSTIAPATQLITLWRLP